MSADVLALTTEKCQGATNRMGDYLASLYLTGRFTGGEVQKLAEAAGDNTDPVCKKLAEAGNAGAHRGNCHRDIMAVLSGDCDRPPVYETDMVSRTTTCESSTIVCVENLGNVRVS